MRKCWNSRCMVAGKSKALGIPPNVPPSPVHCWKQPFQLASQMGCPWQTNYKFHHRWNWLWFYTHWKNIYLPLNKAIGPASSVQKCTASGEWKQLPRTSDGSLSQSYLEMPRIDGTCIAISKMEAAEDNKLVVWIVNEWWYKWLCASFYIRKLIGRGNWC